MDKKKEVNTIQCYSIFLLRNIERTAREWPGEPCHVCHSVCLISPNRSSQALATLATAFIGIHWGLAPENPMRERSDLNPTSLVFSLAKNVEDVARANGQRTYRRY